MPYALPIAGGIAIALVNIVFTWRLSAKRAADFYNLVMAATAAFYLGSALAQGNTNALPLETVLSAAFFGLVMAGQWKSLKYTAIAFLAHGVWDLLHATLGMGASTSVNFSMLCVAYDWVIAGYLWWLAPRTNRS
jgi:hypothetical protein